MSSYPIIFRVKSRLAIIFLFFSVSLNAQNQDSILIRRIFDEALSSRIAYENLRYLCKNTKGRISGTPQAQAAVEFTQQIMSGMDLDTLFLQELMVKRWVRGNRETATVISSGSGKHDLTISALGTSVGTGDEGITSNVVEVKTYEDLARLGEENVIGKIVFFNRPMDPTYYNTFQAYGGAAYQRVGGASEASKYGAKAVIVRSLTTSLDDFPHTGVMYYKEDIPKIPAVSVSTMDADLLSELLKQDPDLQLKIVSNCRNMDEVQSFNVVGEIRGSVYPEQIITVGGHLDAWDTGEGAHDDGVGCVQAIEVLRLFRILGIHPKRTIRAVMFMDEEIAQRGALKYAEMAALNKENHYAAVESDEGGMTPYGYGFSAEDERLERLVALQKYFEPYGFYKFTRGGGGVDIGPLQKFGTLLISPHIDSQRYFDYHHSPNDIFEHVNIREMQLGSAGMAALVYLIDKYDL
jgi:carboxypeptidase Q